MRRTRRPTSRSSRWTTRCRPRSTSSSRGGTARRHPRNSPPRPGSTIRWYARCGSRSRPGPPPMPPGLRAPPDGTFIRASWGSNLGTVEPGSSGSPLYTQQGRYVGQLHGGDAGLRRQQTATGDYGRFSHSWTTVRPSPPLLDPLGTGQLTLDGLNGCAQLAAPAGMTATATTPNTIQIAWNPVPGVAGYDVFRAVGACPQDTVTRIATNVTGTTLRRCHRLGGDDLRLRRARRRRVRMPLAKEQLATTLSQPDGCTLPPTFAGATPVTQPVAGACRLDVNWTAGTSNCGGTLRYNVYRSTDPAFVPGPSNLLQSCVSGVDVSRTRRSPPGTPTTTSFARRTARAAAPAPATAATRTRTSCASRGTRTSSTCSSMTSESGPGLWAVDNPGPGNPWTIVTNQSNSPQSAWFVDDPPFVTDQRLAFANPVTIPVGAPVLSFWHQYDMEGSNGRLLRRRGTGVHAGRDRLVRHPGRQRGRNTRQSIAHHRASVPAERRIVGAAGTRWPGGERGRASASAGWRRKWIWPTSRASRSGCVGAGGPTTDGADAGWWVDDVRISRQQACGMAQSVAADRVGRGCVRQRRSSAQRSGRRRGAHLEEHEQPSPSPRWPACSATSPARRDRPTRSTTRFASYGTLAAGASASCGSNCYAVTATAATRPAVHWDATARRDGVHQPDDEDVDAARRRQLHRRAADQPASTGSSRRSCTRT